MENRGKRMVQNGMPVGIMKTWVVAAAIALAIWPAPCRGLELQVPDRVYQGDLILGRVRPGASVSLSGDPVTASREGYFVLGVSRDRKTDMALRAAADSEYADSIVRVLAYPWRIQRIEGLPQRYVTPSPDALRRIKEDNRRVAAVRESPGLVEPLFLDRGFVQPAAGVVTGRFGSQRILNGRPRSPHSGVDIAAPEGSPVHSPADGVVRLTAAGTVLMGNALMIDHGLGVRSIFIHLQKFLVREGQRVRQGQPVGLVGKTGRATGPHVHWGVSVGATLVDPLRLLERVFAVP